MSQTDELIDVGTMEDLFLCTMLNAFYCEAKNMEATESKQWFSYSDIRQWYVAYKSNNTAISEMTKPKY